MPVSEQEMLTICLPEAYTDGLEGMYTTQATEVLNIFHQTRRQTNPCNW